ncbi:hypothetical protein M422DRAFT_42487 [Sphaerobolus stellatus SS14]|nr:hypothetical protein M422DRAFT_42487 [Sphaerobolus stellatus SS14]
MTIRHTLVDKLCAVLFLLSYIDSYISAGTTQIQVQNALAYLDSVKEQYSEQSQFRKKTLSQTEVLENISQLFYRDAILINGFNDFVPQGAGYAIQASVDGLHVMITTPNGLIHGA